MTAPALTDAMAVARLLLTDFRSYGEATLHAGPGFVVLTGENGAGKTNILEAVSLLAPGRGLRGASLSEMARAAGPGGFAVAARLEDGLEIGTGALAGQPERRQVRVNGAASAANALAGLLTVLCPPWTACSWRALAQGGASWTG